jgi:hypothetical protein
MVIGLHPFNMNFALPGYTSGVFSSARFTAGFIASVTGHRTAGRNVKPFASAQGLSAEIPTGGGPGCINGTAPPGDPTVIRFLFLQVPAGCFSKEVTVILLKPPFTEIVQLMRFALPDGGNRQPAAAFTAAAAGSGPQHRGNAIHIIQ